MSNLNGSSDIQRLIAIRTFTITFKNFYYDFIKCITLSDLFPFAFVTQADSVDVASIMKYVVNNLNQLPTYCFAEENLMPDNCCKATSTKEKHEVPLVSSGPTLLHYDSRHQQQPVKPPPGFLSLGEQHVPSNNTLPTNLRNDYYSFANPSNVKASVFSDAEATTNPFLTDQEVIPDDIARQMYMSVWSENKKFQIRMIDILYDLLECSSLSLKNQVQLNKIFKIIEKALLELKDDRSTVKTSSTSDPANEMSSNNVVFAQETTYNLNGETSTKQDLNANTFPTSNPFGVNDDDENDDDDKSQNNPAFSYDSDFTFNINWNNSDELDPRVQISSSTTANSASSVFANHIPPAKTFRPNANQDGENVPPTPVSSAVPTNNNFSINSFTISNFSEILENMKTEFASMLKNTNPFKGLVADETQVPETRKLKQTSYNYDANFASYLTSKNPQSHASKAETANISATNGCFTPAGRVPGEGYTPRIVYENGPVMYNTPKKQADANTRQNACGNRLDNTRNTQSRELGRDKKSQPANDLITSYMQNPAITRDNSQVGENYVTQPMAYYTQNSQPTTNGAPIYYQQNGNGNDLRSVLSQSWSQIKIPEHRANSKIAFENSLPLSNHSKTGPFGTSTFLPRQDWNYNNRKIAIPRRIIKATEFRSNDSNYTFQFKDSYDKERPMDIYTNSWKSIMNGSTQERNAAINIDTFLFQKIGTIIIKYLAD